MKKFIVDFEGEEEVPQDQYVTFLPRYIYPGDNTRDWATKTARDVFQPEDAREGYDSEWSPETPMWIAKILIHAAYNGETGEWQRRAAPAPAWSILTNSKIYKYDRLYYLDTKGTFPDVVGTQAEVVDTNGIHGIIELASEPEPAPWWEPPNKDELIETVMSMLTEVEREELVRVAEFLAMVPPRDIVWGDLIDAIEHNLRANWEAEGIDNLREWIKSNIDITGVTGG